MKAGSALLPGIAMCWSEGSQENACNQTVCSLDTLNLHLESWSGEQFPMTAGAFLRIQWKVFQQSNTRPHTTVITQCSLQSVDMIPWPARSPNLSPIEHVWDIIGRQLQHHPQLTLIVPVLIQQVQQAWNSIPQNSIRHLYDTLHARLQVCIQISGGYTGY
ncbi:uncharacterized protein TNCV_3656471 [Trichonephila clavipes]|nr:uncharacterized protein TNCV_3656471 [Trichonephila clavipes]